MQIDNILVAFRYRKDLGDLRSLADGIGEIGSLYPVVITPDERPIC